MNGKIQSQSKWKKTLTRIAGTLAATVFLSNAGFAGEVKSHKIRSVSGCTGYTSAVIAQKEAKYHLTIVTYSTKYGINPNLIKAVISVESCYDHMAVSSAGAEGLMQLMPKTAEWLGVSNAKDSEQNLEAGIRYLSNLRKRYNNNNTLALAAYNAGPGNVKKYKGVPPFPETQSYIIKVEKRFRQYQMLDQVAMNTF